MTFNDGSTGHSVTVQDAEARLAHVLVDAIGQLCRLRRAVDEGRDVDLDDLPRPDVVRCVLDETRNVVALGLQLRDGTVQHVASYHLDAIRRHVLQGPGDGSTPPPTSH